MKHDFVIVGLDSFGENLALALQDLGHNVLGIDRDRQVVQRLSDNIRELLVMDATDVETLASIGPEAFNTGIVAIGGDLSQAILVTLALKDVGIKHIVCEAQTERGRRVLLRIGADEVVTPDIESARAIAYQLTSQVPHTAQFRFANHLAIQWRPPHPFEGPLGTLMANYPPDLQVLLMAGSELIYHPGPEEIVTSSDELLITGPEESIDVLRTPGRSDG